MTQDVLGALWFITLLIGIYGMATGDLCLWDAAITDPALPAPRLTCRAPEATLTLPFADVRRR